MPKTEDFKNLLLKYTKVNGDKFCNVTCLLFCETWFPPGHVSTDTICVCRTKDVVVTDIWRLLIRLKWWDISPPKHSVVITQQLT